MTRMTRDQLPDRSRPKSLPEEGQFASDAVKPLGFGTPDRCRLSIKQIVLADIPDTPSGHAAPQSRQELQAIKQAVRLL